MSESPKVYVTQERPDIQYEYAEEFGDVVFVSLADIPTISSSLRARKLISEMRRIMKDYRPEIDYILPSGSPLNMVWVAMVAGQRGNTHKVLKWDRRLKKYSVVLLHTGAVDG